MTRFLRLKYSLVSNLIQIENYEAYLSYQVGFIEPLLMPQLFTFSDRKQVIREYFGKASPENDSKFYVWMWERKRHWCENCGLPLQGYSASFISHIKTRGGHTELRYDPLNINILCLGCHNEWEYAKFDDKKKMYIYQVNKTRNLL